MPTNGSAPPISEQPRMDVRSWRLTQFPSGDQHLVPLRDGGIARVMSANESEVIAAANDTPFGLAAHFFSCDVQRIWRVAEALETGIVGINEGSLATEQGVRLRPRGLALRARRLHAHEVHLPDALMAAHVGEQTRNDHPSVHASPSDALLPYRK